MTVKCISTNGKTAIVTMFQNNFGTIDELAVTYCCSRRTIIRVLEEVGIDPGIRRRVHKPKHIIPHEDVPLNLTFPDHAILPKQSWFQRTLSSMARIFPIH